MTQKIVDLDALAGSPRKVKLDGQTFTLPSDIPAPLYIKLLHIGELGDRGEDPSSGDVIDLYDRMLKLFQVHQPELEELPIGLTQLMESVGALYGQPDDEPGPTRSRTTASSRSRSASSRS